MAIRDSNMLKLGEFVHYKTKPLFFLTAWLLRASTKCSGEVSMIIFPDII